jgi:phage shock protein A
MNLLEDFKEDALQRITRLEGRADHTDKKLEELYQDGKVLGKLTTLMELQVESNKRQDEQMQKQNETMLKMSHSMEKMSDSYEKLDGRVGKLETNDSNKKIDLGVLAKHVLFSVVPTLIAAYFLIRLGLK